MRIAQESLDSPKNGRLMTLLNRTPTRPMRMLGLWRPLIADYHPGATLAPEAFVQLTEVPMRWSPAELVQFRMAADAAPVANRLMQTSNLLIKVPIFMDRVIGVLLVTVVFI